MVALNGMSVAYSVLFVVHDNLLERDEGTRLFRSSAMDLTGESVSFLSTLPQTI